MKIEVCKGQAGLALYVDDERVAGPRHNGLMKTVLSATVCDANEWMPIETAPDDRFWVFLHVPGHGPVRARRYPFYGWKSIDGRPITQATHWQPLPKPPVQT